MAVQQQVTTVTTATTYSSGNWSSGLFDFTSDMNTLDENGAVDSEFPQDVFGDESDWIPSITEGVTVFPDTPICKSPKDMLDRRLQLLREILFSEETYLNELETLLMPLKALRASAGTSQPVLSIEQVQTVFYQLPELLDLHTEFYSSLRAKLQMYLDLEPGLPMDLDLFVGDLFIKFVSQLGVYRGFIDNYENAVEIVKKCTQSDPRFRTIAQSMKSTKGSDSSKAMYTFEALLYKPLDRVTKTTLVLHDLLKHTPTDHYDIGVLQEALRVSSSFLSGLNEGSQCKTSVTLSRGKRRQLVRDGFVVDVCNGGRSLRHLFLYTDLLLCVKLKYGAMGRQPHYRFCWYMPIAGLRMNWAAEQDATADLQFKINNMRLKMFHLRRAFRQFMSHTIHLHSLYELEEWKEAINHCKAENIETVPPDLLSLTNSCVKLRMTQQLPLCCLKPESAKVLYFFMTAGAYVCVEVDGFEIFERRAQTCLSSHSLMPQWDQELVLKVDGAQHLHLLCISPTEENILGRATIQLNPADMLKKWKKINVNMDSIEVMLSIKYTPHPLEPPSSTLLEHQPVFGVLIEDVARQERVLVPHIVRSCVDEVERRGMEEEGIYRISGASNELQALKHAFNTNYWEAMSKVRNVDVNVVSGALKLYLRELPEPLIPVAYFERLSKAMELTDPNLRESTMLSELQSFTDVSRNTLLFLLHHLKGVAEKEQLNKMSLSNLATVFGPTLMRPPVASVDQCSPPVDISQEVDVQVHVIYLYLQIPNLPEAFATKPLDTEEDS
ncbi:Active breakpoint cluster region-related protein [Bagarius yarrelli]|uniref:Active breakpoint cluster region-related protein n=1 Tax=Bagarius yarrelli TaxID=175774 RepID=A0A556TZ98_BAGYA|nr:Active breakpoint cluster region-related protein [Bagarius yarrelli]